MSFSAYEIDEICCEWGPPEYVATEDCEAWYWRFPGHDLPVADNLSELFVAALQLKPLKAVPPSEAGTVGETTRIDRQISIGKWAVAAFGEAEATSLPQRGVRLLEEAAEAAQATGVGLEQAKHLMDYVWGRPAGELYQELGGIGVTVLALAQAAGLDADKCEAIEVHRVLGKPIEHFTKRNKEKNDAGLLAALKPIAAIRGDTEGSVRSD